jgi:uncharacterized membrane protein YsdA (DUF1294 family)
MTYFLVYLLFMNGLAFALMGIDKRRAKRHAWRIPELTLMLVGVFGGSVGGLLGMQVFRHKTKHPKFFIGYPVILVVHVALAVYFLVLR